MKIDRRALLTSGAAVSAVAWLPGMSVAAFATDNSHIERFVFDTRFARAVEAGHAANAQGIRASAVDGDLTSLWYHDLSLKWQRRPMTIAGVTAEDALFVLGTLASDHRMRVVEKTELDAHVPMRDHYGAGALPLYAWVIAPRGSSLRGL